MPHKQTPRRLTSGTFGPYRQRRTDARRADVLAKGANYSVLNQRLITWPDADRADVNGPVRMRRNRA